MTLVTILILMLLTIGIGKRSRPGFKPYLVIGLITLVQVGIAVYHMFTMDMPPLQ